MTIATNWAIVNISIHIIEIYTNFESCIQHRGRASTHLLPQYRGIEEKWTLWKFNICTLYLLIEQEQVMKVKKCYSASIIYTVLDHILRCCKMVQSGLCRGWITFQLPQRTHQERRFLLRYFPARRLAQVESMTLLIEKMKKLRCAQNP